MRASPEVMAPILLCWPTTLEADAGSKAVEAERPHQHPVIFYCHVTDDSKGAVWKMVFDHVVQRCGREFFHMEKMSPIDMHQHSLWAQHAHKHCL